MLIALPHVITKLPNTNELNVKGCQHYEINTIGACLEKEKPGVGCTLIAQTQISELQLKSLAVDSCACAMENKQRIMENIPIGRIHAAFLTYNRLRLGIYLPRTPISPDFLYKAAAMSDMRRW